MGALIAAISFARLSANTLIGSRSHAFSSGAKNATSRRAATPRAIAIRLVFFGAFARTSRQNISRFSFDAFEPCIASSHFLFPNSEQGNQRQHRWIARDHIARFGRLDSCQKRGSNHKVSDKEPNSPRIWAQERSVRVPSPSSAPGEPNPA